MDNFWLWFWTIMIFSSIAWYGFLVFFIGFKGGKEIKTMVKDLEQRDKNP
jgi:hypothetical protein